MRKSHRTEAKEALLAAAGRQERHYLQQNVYVIDNADIADVASPVTTNGYYNITTASCSGSSDTCFIMTATATGSQASDTGCATFTIDNTGAKASKTSADVLTTQCW